MKITNFNRKNIQTTIDLVADNEYWTSNEEFIQKVTDKAGVSYQEAEQIINQYGEVD